MPISDEYVNLNSAQYEAVTYAGTAPLLVLAGPGSGKTHTLTKRILYLISNLGISPDKILVFTFTKSAAMEMQNRFASLCEKYELNGNVNFGTFHSVFYAILRQSGQYHHLKLMSQGQKKEILVPILKSYYSKDERLLQGYVYNLATEVLEAISLYQNTLDLSKIKKHLPIEIREGFESIYEQYQRQKAAKNLIDFDDMLSLCLKMFLENEEQKNYWQNRFSYLLIDEFQDINPIQYEVMKILGKNSNLFAVGDDDQAIYGFRGANPKCMKQYEQDFHAKKILLNVNYRSEQEIVETSGKIICENMDRFEKSLISGKRNGQKEDEEEKKEEIEEENVKIVKLTDQISQLQFIEDYTGKMGREESVAILFRTNSQMQKMASSFRRLHLSFWMKEKETDIYQHFIVKDMVAYLRFVRSDQDYDSFKTIANKPFRAISMEALLKNHSLWELRKYYKERGEGVECEQIRMIDLLCKNRTHLVNKPLYLQLTYIRKVMGYNRYLEQLAMHTRNDYSDWSELLDWLEMESKSYKDLESWIWDMNRFHEEKGKIQDEKKRDDNKHICLMTVHASKGLEFDHIILPDCNERFYPYGNLPDEETVAEERRLFYVAVTRAKKSLRLLYLTGTKESPRQPSRFIRQLIRQTHNCQDTHQKLLQPFHIHHHRR